MPQNETPSRYEINQKVRMIFTRHDADLSKIDYSFMGATVYLSGELAQPDRDYSHKEIENIVKEISAIPKCAIFNSTSATGWCFPPKTPGR